MHGSDRRIIRTLSPFVTLILLLFSPSAPSEEGGHILFVPSPGGGGEGSGDLSSMKEGFPGLLHLYHLFGNPPPFSGNVLLFKSLEEIKREKMVNLRYEEAVASLKSLVEGLPGMMEVVEPELLFNLFLFKGIIRRNLGEEGFREDFEQAVSILEDREIPPSLFPPSIISDFGRVKGMHRKRERVRLVVDGGGFEVFLNGRPVLGRNQEVLPGNHLVQFVRPGYPISGGMIRVEEGDEAIPVTPGRFQDLLPGVSALLTRYRGVEGVRHISSFLEEYMVRNGLKWLAFIFEGSEGVVMKRRGEEPNLIEREAFALFSRKGEAALQTAGMGRPPPVRISASTYLTYLFLGDTHYTGLFQEGLLHIRDFMISVEGGIALDLLNLGKPDQVHRYGETYLYFLIPLRIRLLHSTPWGPFRLFYGPGLLTSVPSYRGPSGGTYDLFLPVQGSIEGGAIVPMPLEGGRGVAALSMGYGTEGLHALISLGVNY